MSDPSARLDDLRNRVEGLQNRTIDRLIKADSDGLRDLMRGETPVPRLTARMEANLTPEDFRAVLDFNRAARYLCFRLGSGDLASQGIGGSNDPLTEPEQRYLRTRDLRFDVLGFGDNDRRLHLPLAAATFDRLAASLFLSYLFNPEDLLGDLYRMLKPGGILMASTMKPDSDISVIFTDYVQKVRRFELEDTDIRNRDVNLKAARAMLNEAASLFTLEEDGYFRFFSPAELVSLFRRAGFVSIRQESSMGTPPQAIIVTGRKPRATRS